MHSEAWRTTYTGLLPDEHVKRRTPENRAALWREMFARGDADVFVACDAAGTIAGFIAGGTPDDRLAGYDSELLVFYLLESAQRRGVGARLLQTLAHALVQRGFGAMSVLVLGANPARAFYERMGAKVLEERRVVRDGFEYHDVYYGWPDLRKLLTPP